LSDRRENQPGKTWFSYPCSFTFGDPTQPGVTAEKEIYETIFCASMFRVEDINSSALSLIAFVEI